MLEEFAKLIPTIAQAILASGNAGIIALLAVIVAIVFWFDNKILRNDNKTLRDRIDAMQEKRIEEVRIVTQLVEKFTGAMETALSALYKKGI